MMLLCLSMLLMVVLVCFSGVRLGWFVLFIGVGMVMMNML